MFVLANICQAVAMILDKVFWLYGLVIFIAVLITWVSPDPFNPIVQFLRAVTEPVFGWVRRHVPFAMLGMLDLSPMIVLFSLWFLRLALVPTLFDLAVRLR